MLLLRKRLEQLTEITSLLFSLTFCERTEVAAATTMREEIYRINSHPRGTHSTVNEYSCESTYLKHVFGNSNCIGILLVEEKQ